MEQQTKTDLKSLQAAQSMRNEMRRKQVKAMLVLILWALFFITVSLSFATLTAQPLLAVSGNQTISYVLGAFLHLLLGLAFHLWKVGRHHRNPYAVAYLVFGLILIGAVVIVGWLRVTLQLQTVVGSAMQILPMEQITVYVTSLFATILEIVAPMLLGLQLASSWLAYEREANLYRYTAEFHKRLGNENDQLQAWIDEASRLEGKIDQLKNDINESEDRVTVNQARDNHEEVKQAQTEIARAKAELAYCEDCLTLIQKWFPGSNTDLNEGDSRAT